MGVAPFGWAKNDYATLHPERFQTTEDACNLAKPGVPNRTQKQVTVPCPSIVTTTKSQDSSGSLVGRKQHTYLNRSRL